MSRARRLASIAMILAALPIAASSCAKKKPTPRAPIAAASASADAPDVDEEGAPAIAEIDLSRGAPETKSGLLRSERGTYFDLVEAIASLHDDEDTRGVLVRLGGARLGWARVEETAKALRGLREANKVVYCHADDAGNATYWLLAEGCDRIWLSPAGGLQTVGIAAEMLFAHDLLTKVGVDADILQIGKYKGANEMMTRSGASEEARQSISGVLTDLRARWLSGVQTGRGRHELVRGLEAGPHSPSEARAVGLIDEVGYLDEARRALRARVGRGPSEIVFGPLRDRRGTGGGFVELVRTLSGGKRKGGGGRAHVAVLRASGAITMERSSGALGSQDGIDARAMIKSLRALAADGQTKAVVLRIDSPGGSALASDLMWHEIMLLRKKKPVIVSIGDMAASGGYYLACAGTKIVAEESSIVGSIGVVGGKLTFGRALHDLGVNTETVAADPAASARAAYLSPFTRWDDATRERVRSTMQDVYDLFLRRVAEGRGMPLEKVRTFAEGRLWSGREGRALGMVDAWGGLGAAIELARVEGHLDPGAEVRVVGRETDLFDVLGLDELDPQSLAARPDGLAALVAETPGADAVTAFAASVGPLLGTERALVAVPFAILIRLRGPGRGRAAASCRGAWRSP